MKQLFILLLLIFASSQSYTQGIIPPSEIAKAKAIMSTDNISQADIVNALKLTLVLGLNDAINDLGKKNGFYKDDAVHIDLPPELQKVVDANNDIKKSLSDALDKEINRVAEQSMSKAKPIFKDQLDKVKFLNGLNTLLSKEDEATQDFQKQAYPVIVSKLTPVIQKLLDKSDASNQLNQILSQVKDKTGIGVSVNLTDYVTQQAVNGVFEKMSKNEQKMKLSQTIRSTLLLKTVFDMRDKVIR